MRFLGSKVCQYDSNTSWFFSMVRKMPATATRVVLKKKAIKRMSEPQYLVKCIFMIQFQFNPKSTNFDSTQRLCLRLRIFVLKFTGFAAAILNSRILIC